MGKPMYRQGDVLLVQESSQRSMFKRNEQDEARLILAHGEKTGHTHSVPATDATLETVPTGAGFVNELSVHEATELTHQEHAPIPLSPGIYRVVLQRQYDPVSDRPVDD